MSPTLYSHPHPHPPHLSPISRRSASLPGPCDTRLLLPDLSLTAKQISPGHLRLTLNASHRFLPRFASKMQILKSPTQSQATRTHRKHPQGAMPAVSARPQPCSRVASSSSPSVQPRVVVARSSAVELEEIDPVTGIAIPKLSATNPVAGLSVDVKGVKWAYRRSDVAADKASADKPAVLLLHGLGSSSFSYRTTLGLLGADGYEAIAPDWPGHGDSDKPSSFNYSEENLIAALDSFVSAVGIKTPVAVVVQGFVLSQYALLWATQNEGKVARLMILNTPLSLNSKLRPELAAYKAPLSFMRPKTFDGMIFNATGSAYVMEGRTADAYARPYADPAASAAVAACMDKVDFNKLLNKVNNEYQTWRKPSVLLFGGSDPFLKVGDTFTFLEDKRTNMKVVSAAAKLGHMPQEDFAEAVHEIMVPFLTGESDAGVMKNQKLMKMTKKGGVSM